MTIPVFKVKERPALLNKARVSDYLYNDIDTVFNLANLYYIKEVCHLEFKLVNMVTGKDNSISFATLKSGNWQINLIPQHLRRSLRMN